MKGSEFIKLLRKVIREEVKTVVKEELNAIKPILMEVINSQAKSTKRKPAQPIKRTQPIVTMDSIDGMLNEGVFDTNEWPDINGGPMTSDLFAGDSDFGINGFAPQQLQQIQQVQPRGSNMSDPLLKDYSQVLKAADQRAQSYRGV